MELLKGANLALAFIIEIAMLVAYGYWGFHLDASTVVKVIIGIGAPVVVIGIWALFFAPTADRRLEQPWLMMGKIVIFAVATWLLFQANRQTMGVILAIVTAVNFALAALWNQDTAQ